jgi:hypothetical protein
MFNFFLEVLEFKYNKQELFEYQASITEWASNFHSAKKGTNTMDRYKWFDYYPVQTEPLMVQVSSAISLPLKQSPFKIVKTLAGGSLPYHIDPYRECVLMLPLTDNNAGLEWIDRTGKVIGSCTYKGPTVINAKIMHGVPFNDKDRIFLQVDIPCTWDYMIENYNSIFKL